MISQNIQKFLKNKIIQICLANIDTDNLKVNSVCLLVMSVIAAGFPVRQEVQQVWQWQNEGKIPVVFPPSLPQNALSEKLALTRTEFTTLTKIIVDSLGGNLRLYNEERFSKEFLN